MSLHLYGVVASGAAPPGLVGRREQPLRAIGDDRLDVLVSDVDDEVRVRRDDLLAHAHVLERVAEHTSVVPVQFGVVVPDDEAVRRDLLEAEGAQLGLMLSRFDGLVQLTVQAAHREDAALRELLLRDADLVAFRDEVRRHPDDHRLQMRLGETVAAALERLRHEDADAVLAQLEPHVRALSLNETRGAHDVVNVAVLVERERRGDLDAAVTVLREQLGSRLEVRYVGPQPAYAFLDGVSSEEPAWA